MRRIAFISDVHANLEALEAVLRDLEAQKPDRRTAGTLLARHLASRVIAVTD